MTARRTRSLNELPGHLRVPILRRKDTQRTKDRLAAGLAGIEELRTLRQQQQQLVGETVAKAGDKRQERRQGERCVGVILMEDTSSRTSTSSRHGCSPSSPQPLQSPKRPTPHPRSFFRGHSMDSISEEGDANAMLTNGSRHCQVVNSSGHRHPDINNNGHNSINIKTTPDINTTTAWENISIDGSFESDYQNQPNANNSCSSPQSQKQIHHNCGGEIRSSGILQSQPKQHLQQMDANPERCCNVNDTPPHQNQYQSFSEDNKRISMTNAPPIPTRRRSLSSRPFNEPPNCVSSRQRSMSVDMGQHNGPSFEPLCHPVTSKNSNLHKFSSLTSINAYTNNTHDVARNDINSMMCAEDGHRLSRSMTQINHAGQSRPPHASSLKRRGSLTWDGLLKSIGLPNSATSDSQNNINDANIDANNNDKSRDDVFHSENESSEERMKILANRKKGRSMSFTCGGNATNILSPKHHSLQSAKLNSPDASYGLETVLDQNSSPERTSNPHQSMHPILRRASIQCEAVLTHSNKVVNPIQDVDVNSFNSPGPLHAVMLQYRGYRSPNSRTEPSKANNKENNSITNVLGTPKPSNECSHGRSNSVKHSLSQITKDLSDLTSHRRGSSEGVIPTESTMLEKQDQPCCNVRQEIKVVGRENEKVSTTEEYFDKEGENMDKDVIINNPLHVNNINNVTVSPLSATPVLAEVSENSFFSSSSEVVESEYITSSSKLRQTNNLSDVNNRDSHQLRHIVGNSSAVNDLGDSCGVIDREIQNERGYVEKTTNSANLSKLSNSQRKRISTSRESGIICDKSNPINVQDVRHNSIQNNNDKTYSNSNVTDLEVRDNEQNKRSNSNSQKENESISTWQNKEKKNSCLHTQDTHTQFHDNDSNSNLFKSIPQSERQRLYIRHSIDAAEVDAIRNKRASIFSEVSLMSDLSSKTPSSSASVFSDVSMISDEGYSTCESLSPDSKMAHLRRFNPAPKRNSHSLSEVTLYPTVSNERLNNSVYNHEINSPSYDNNGNNINQSESETPKEFEKQSSRSFRYEREMTLENTAPVVFVKPTQSQKTSYDQRHVYRKPLKQTTV